MSTSTITRKKTDSSRWSESPEQTACTGNARGRSESSPAQLSIPEKPASPLMKSPQNKVPRLDLSVHSADDQEIQHSSAPVLKSPKSASVVSPRVRFASSSVVVCSSSAPTTPRSKSPRPADEARSPRRSRIEASPRKAIDVGKRDITSLHATPAYPRKINDELIQLGREVAKLIFADMTARTPVLTTATIDQLGRFETLIPIDSLSAKLRARLPGVSGPTVSHAKLINVLFEPLLAGSEVGKTLATMRRNVMELYDGYTLTLADRIRREETDLGFKERMLNNMAPQAEACAAVTLGVKSIALSESKLPAELIAVWKAMDAELCQWAGRNPDLPPAELKRARANIAFDFLFTRLLLPMASGPKEDAPLAIPVMFFDAVKRALKADWPKFLDSFIRSVDQDRSVAMPPCSTSSTSAMSSAIDHRA